jgi:hypothetical protein
MTEQFIKKARLVHGDRYDYSKVDYTNGRTKVIIICEKHGEFQQSPDNHYYRGSGCPKCAKMLNGNKRKTQLDVFIKKCREKHGDSYDYSKVDYVKNCINVIIICQEHGEFQQRPDKHLASRGCPKCSGHYTSTTEDFIIKSKEMHGDIYGYSKVDYKNSGTKVIIICQKHGEFEQIPCNHLYRGAGCPKCSLISNAEKRKITTEEFIEKSKLIHGDLYDYSIVDYKKSKENVSIVCNIHGEFLQKPNYHLSGSGCPKCSNCCYSKPSILWLDFLSKLYNINIQHASNDGEYVITTTKYKADGYCKENNTIYEFHGDYWHGNPKVFNPDDINEITKCTYKDLYDKTLIRENKIKELGYNLITIWENDWKKLNKCIKILQQKFRNYN